MTHRTNTDKLSAGHEFTESFVEERFRDGHPVYWRVNGSLVSDVREMGDEPGLCAVLESGGYVALYAADKYDFIIGARL